jgi:hypothetical protein
VKGKGKDKAFKRKCQATVDVVLSSTPKIQTAATMCDTSVLDHTTLERLSGEEANFVESRLAAAQQKICAWSKAQVIEHEEQRDAHETRMAQYELDIAALEERGATLQAEREQQGEQQHSEANELVQLRETLSAMKLESETLPTEVAKFNEENDRRAQRVSGRKAEREAEVARQKETVNELEAKLARFKQLGLHFVRAANDALTLVFTLIDPRDHMREFEFSVRVDEATDAYVLRSCCPEVEGVDALIQRLNEDNDFSRFVQSMRVEFKKVVAGEAR